MFDVHKGNKIYTYPVYAISMLQNTPNTVLRKYSTFLKCEPIKFQ